jgi:hypothetical protein
MRKRFSLYYVVFLGSGPPINQPCVVRTVHGPCCTFPFIYRRRRYSQCIRDYHVRLWCAITDNYDKDRAWGDCLILTPQRYRRGNKKPKTFILFRSTHFLTSFIFFHELFNSSSKVECVPTEDHKRTLLCFSIYLPWQKVFQLCNLPK